MKVTILEQLPAWHFARHRTPLRKVEVERATDWAQKAQRATRREPEAELLGRGIKLSVQSLSFGSVKFRARLNLRHQELVVDAQAEADLHEEMLRLGFPVHPSARELILAHELFHVLCPRCPSDLAEMAAHLYAALVLDLDYYPGILDVALHLGLGESLSA